MVNTYIVLINRNVYYRHDCYFEQFQNEPSLLQEEETNRLVDTFFNETIENYDEIFGPQKDDFTVEPNHFIEENLKRNNTIPNYKELQTHGKIWCVGRK
jgi:hypothetical protein